jgi:sugar lactone lactonase YvrE
MKTVLLIFAVAMALLLTWLLFSPVAISPAGWQPDADPGMSGAFRRNDALEAVVRLTPGIGEGPEDVALGPSGLLYTGLQDGRIVRFLSDGRIIDEWINTGGRPLGMQFDAQYNLIVADSTRGLLKISPTGDIEVLTDSVDGQRMIFVDDLDIADNGVIWFTDASQRFGQDEWRLDLIEGSFSGRLLSYNPQNGRTQVRIDKLGFANGVALGPNDEYVLVNETLKAKIHRLWLKGPLTGTRDVFVSSLPGYPDNLSYNGEDMFWVALPSPRQKILESVAGSPFMLKVIARLPESFGPRIPALGWVIGIDLTGQVRYSMQDWSGTYSGVTSVNEIDGQLFLGSIAMHSVGAIKLPE